MTESTDGARPTGWRAAMWAVAGLLLLLPWLATHWTEEVRWDLADFILFGLMLLGACSAFEFAARASGSWAYRGAVGVAVAGAFTLTWMNLAVGIIGSEDHPANLMHFGVLAIGALGALAARFRAHGMARALAATAVAQAIIAMIALLAGFGYAAMLTAFFATIWLASAGLFRKAAREQPLNLRS